jgi:nucleotide-binding universal stress UspA family protein
LSGLSDRLPQAGIDRDSEPGEYADWLAASALPAGTRVRRVIEHGALETALTRYVREHDIELVVLGVHGRNRTGSCAPCSVVRRPNCWTGCRAIR